MSAQAIDYAAMLANMEAKKAALEAAIASLRAALAMGALGSSSSSDEGATVSLGSMMYGGDVPNGAFLGKSIPEAARLYLEIIKKKQTSREIAEALQKGGVESTSKNFIGMIGPVLERARRNANPVIVKVGNQWGLSSWYPKGILNATAPPAAKRKAVKKRKKAAEAKAAATEPASVAGKASDRAVAFMSSKPGTAFAVADVGAHIGMGTKGARLVLGKLAKAGKIEKSGVDLYRVQRS
jgi:hypothetical protein